MVDALAERRRETNPKGKLAWCLGKTFVSFGAKQVVMALVDRERGRMHRTEPRDRAEGERKGVTAVQLIGD